MKKVLVTGGAGFLGSHLCEFLLNKGFYVICLDNLYTGSEKNISHLKSNPNFKFINHDILESIFLDVDQIYNLACPASPIHYQRDPVRTIKTSTLGVINILELAKKNGARILQASTSEIYGDPLVHPQTEDYRGNVNTIGPRSCYDEAKRVAESLLFDYKRQFNTDIKLIRIFNTYGPNMAKNDGRVISNFILAALNNENIQVYGSGNQTRSFCYVSDLIEALYLMMNTEDFTGPVNLGNPTEYTILETAKKVIELTNSKSQIEFKELPIDDPIKRKPDISLAKQKLNWEPKIPLEQGLIKTIEYFKNN